MPYLPAEFLKDMMAKVLIARPDFIYIGRSSFLSETYPANEAFTLQRASFRDHGPQIDIGAYDLEKNFAIYSKRHFKWSEISVLEDMGYVKILEFDDRTGLTHMGRLGTHTQNGLWQLRT